MNSRTMKWALLAGVAYFVCMAIAHFFGIKLPLLFIYYDTPFFAYQDKIISFAVCAYIGLFYAASKHRDVALIAIMVLTLTVSGLSAINLSSDLLSILQEDQTTLPYWIQTAAIAVYLIVLIALYLRDRSSQESAIQH